MGTFSYVHGTIWGLLSPIILSLGTTSTSGVKIRIWVAGGLILSLGTTSTFAVRFRIWGLVSQFIGSLSTSFVHGK